MEYTSAVVGVVGVGAQVCTTLYKIADSALNAKDDILDLIKSIERTNEVLENVSKALSQRRFRSIANNNSISLIRQIVADCDVIYTRFQTSLEEQTRTDKNGVLKVRSTAQILYIFRSDRFKLEKERLGSLKQEIVVLLLTLRLVDMSQKNDPYQEVPEDTNPMTQNTGGRFGTSASAGIQKVSSDRTSRQGSFRSIESSPKVPKTYSVRFSLSKRRIVASPVRKKSGPKDVARKKGLLRVFSRRRDVTSTTNASNSQETELPSNVQHGPQHGPQPYDTLDTGNLGRSVRSRTEASAGESSSSRASESSYWSASESVIVTSPRKARSKFATRDLIACYGAVWLFMRNLQQQIDYSGESATENRFKETERNWMELIKVVNKRLPGLYEQKSTPPGSRYMERSSDQDHVHDDDVGTDVPESREELPPSVEAEAAQEAERKKREEAKLETEHEASAKNERRQMIEEEVAARMEAVKQKEQERVKSEQEQEPLRSKSQEIKERVVPDPSPDNPPDNSISDKILYFRDALGRKFLLPWPTVRTWEGMETVIKPIFQHVDILGPHVNNGCYDLVGPEDQIILPQFWDVIVQPGWNITMQLWPLPEQQSGPDMPIPGPANIQPEEVPAKRRPEWETQSPPFERELQQVYALKMKLEMQEREEREREERAYREYMWRQKEKEEAEEKAYHEFLYKQRDRQEAEEKTRKEEQAKVDAVMKARLEKLGYTGEEIEIMLDPDKAEKEKRKTKKKHRHSFSPRFEDDGVVMMPPPISAPPTTFQLDHPQSLGHVPVYPRINRKHLDIETLNHYDIPWEWDRANPKRMILLRELDDHEVDVFFEHTRRRRQDTSSTVKETAPKFAWIRRKSKEEGSKRRGRDLEVTQIAAYDGYPTREAHRQKRAKEEQLLEAVEQEQVQDTDDVVADLVFKYTNVDKFGGRKRPARTDYVVGPNTV